MKLLFRTPKIVDVFLDDDITPQHGWGNWSKFHIHTINGQKKLILLAGNSLSNADFQKLKESV